MHFPSGSDVDMRTLAYFVVVYVVFLPKIN
jgi:hypothetical protein